MSEPTHADHPTGAAETGPPDEPLPGVPPVAGGTDDSPPAQGRGEDDSW